MLHEEHVVEARLDRGVYNLTEVYMIGSQFRGDIQYIDIKILACRFSVDRGNGWAMPHFVLVRLL